MRKNNTVIGSATLVMAVVILSKILGFLRQTVIADAYGATLETDIYFLSSDFMISLSGAFLASLTTALVTVYIDIRTKKSKEEANTVASTMLTMFLFIGCVFILLINLFTPWIARLLESDYPPEAHNTLVQYLRIFSVTFIFTALQSIYAAVLNANNTFTPGKLYGIIYNPIAIFMVLAFAGKWGISALIVAYFAANIIQTLLLGLWARKNYSYRPSVNFRDPTIKHLIYLSAPLLLSNIFIQLNGIIDKMICSRLGEGIASNYSYAYTLEQFITATITATLSLILLSRYATYVSEGNTEMVVKTFKESLSGLLVLLVPITIVACVMSPEIVKIVYMRGKFDETAAYHTSRALIGFAVGFGLIAVREMYIRLHFAYQDTKMPMVANIAAVFLNAALSFLLAPYIGVLGVALATSLSVILTICLLNRSVKKYLPNFRFLAMRKLLIKLTVAGAATAATALVMRQILQSSPIVEFLLCAFAALLVYALSLILMRCEELYAFIGQLHATIRRKLTR